ncbi:methyltransferase [soil metagenome]
MKNFQLIANTLAILWITIIVGWWLRRYIIIPYFERKRLYAAIPLQVKHCFEFINRLYQNVDAVALSKQIRQHQGLNDDAFVYGEIEVLSFANMLEIVKPIPGEIFYDLGCGSGKAVFTAAMLYEFSKCYGIELLQPMHQLCCQQLTQFSQLLTQANLDVNPAQHIEFIHQNILQVDFRDGDIIFINATAFFGELWDAIVQRLYQLKSGSRVILTSRKLPATDFTLLSDEKQLMSWGMSSVFIYQRR